MRLQLPVNILSGILDNDSIPLRLIQCNHNPSKQSLLINLAERFRLSICILAILIKITSLTVQEFNISNQELLRNMIERNVLALISHHPENSTTHQYGTRSLTFCLILRSHILAIRNEIQFTSPVPILKTKLTILNVDDILSLDRISQLHLLLIPLLILPSHLRTQIKIQKLILPDTINVAIQVDRLVATLQLLKPDLNRLLNIILSSFLPHTKRNFI